MINRTCDFCPALKGFVEITMVRSQFDILQYLWLSARPKRWIKNIPLFAALIFSQNLFNPISAESNGRNRHSRNRHLLFSLHPSHETIQKFHTENLWLTIPIVLYGIFRYPYLIYQKERGGNPETVFFENRPVLLAIGLYAIVVGIIICS